MSEFLFTIKKLVWKTDENDEEYSKTNVGSYFIQEDTGWSYFQPDEWTEENYECESIEDAKIQAQEHYNKIISINLDPVDKNKGKAKVNIV